MRRLKENLVNQIVNSWWFPEATGLKKTPSQTNRVPGLKKIMPADDCFNLENDDQQRDLNKGYCAAQRY